jgi:protein-tyrosine phosphatase
MIEVDRGLFLGDTKDAARLESLEANRISLVLVVAKGHPRFFPDKIEYVYYPLVDDETDNVLRFVDEAVEKMLQALRAGKNVFVHCVCGVSRSVAITTGFFMKRDSLGFTEAYALLCSRYRFANMALNFQEQLEVYGKEFAWDMQLNTQKHRMYRTAHRISFERPVQVDSSSPEARFICRKCRESLFLDVHCISCVGDNHLIECMQWMASQVDPEKKGPIQCPQCRTKIGHFDWTGLLITNYSQPGFVITGSKVDRMPLTCTFKGTEFPLTRF